MGDQNAHDPLWKMPEKGVFTADLTKALIERHTDIVVHSWKDLPTEPHPETMIAATLPRADARDLLLVKKAAIQGWENLSSSEKVLHVLSSSPRRAYHLNEFLKWALPLQPREVRFANVRGNIQTRVRKLLEGDAHALVVAKAAMDRLLSAPEEEFSETRKFLREALSQCEFVVLPLSQCPGAAAQGALAIEIRRDRTDLIHILEKINCPNTFYDVQGERATLSSYGGGCHQKIGVTFLSRSFGQVRFVRGETDAGQVICRREIVMESHNARKTHSKVPAHLTFPQDMSEAKFYTREPLPVDLVVLKERPHFILVSRENALPEKTGLHSDSIVWTAGLKTWRHLAGRGIWVHGTTDGLGESEDPRLEHIVEKELSAVKLSHREAPDSQMKVIATYALKDIAELPDLSGKTHFYWASSSAFERALKRYPEIAGGEHACGPGHTYTRLREILGESGKIKLFLSFKDWREATVASD